MKEKNIICTLVILLCIFSFGTLKASKVIDVIDKEELQQNDIYLCDNYEKFDNISFPRIGSINNKEVYSYCEFTNQENALQNFVKEYIYVFDYFQKKYKLDTINEENWKKYYELLYEDDNEELFVPVQILKGFFDIYENKEKNDELKNNIKEYNELKNVKNSDNSNNIDKLVDSIKNNIPYYNNEIVNSDLLKTSVMKTSSQSFSRSNGIKYAVKYAENPNKTKYGVASRDCTNFTSQILENGGYSQVWGLTNRFGWWYKKSDSTFKYSWSWVNADSFIKYWGVKYYTTNFNTFSKKIKAGDFILQDSNNDGDYNHAGFVTAITNNNKKYEIDNENLGVCTMVEFKDFKVAQHTSNYNRLVSDTKNNWEYGVFTKTRYAIVDINYS